MPFMSSLDNLLFIDKVHTYIIFHKGVDNCEREHANFWLGVHTREERWRASEVLFPSHQSI